jgi:hypothetical protein
VLLPQFSADLLNLHLLVNALFSAIRNIFSKQHETKIKQIKTSLKSFVALFRERTIPTERQLLVGEVANKFSG